MENDPELHAFLWHIHFPAIASRLAAAFDYVIMVHTHSTCFHHSVLLLAAAVSTATVCSHHYKNENCDLERSG